jgi:hypothetical protein
MKLITRRSGWLLMISASSTAIAAVSSLNAQQADRKTTPAVVMPSPDLLGLKVIRSVPDGASEHADRKQTPSVRVPSSSESGVLTVPNEPREMARILVAKLTGQVEHQKEQLRKTEQCLDQAQDLLRKLEGVELNPPVWEHLEPLPRSEVGPPKRGS